MKKLLLMVPVTLLLTSCGAFKIGFDNRPHSAGIEGNNSSSKKTYVESHSMFTGDTINENNKSVANITFTADDGLSNLTPAQVDERLTCDVNDLFLGTVETLNVGTRENSYLFIGASSSFSDGYMTLEFAQAIKDVKIEATPYYFAASDWNNNRLIKDENVCVAVNTSNFIPLAELANEDGDAIVSTICRYNIAEDQTQIKIKVGGQKAFIKKITLYY